jgi:hypothetical protein
MLVVQVERTGALVIGNRAAKPSPGDLVIRGSVNAPEIAIWKKGEPFIAAVTAVIPAEQR